MVWLIPFITQFFLVDSSVRLSKTTQSSLAAPSAPLRSPVLWQRVALAFGQFVVTGIANVLQLTFLISVSAAIFVQTTLPEIPDVQRLRTIVLQQPLQVFSNDGVFMGEFGVEQRQTVPLADIPNLIIHAFLATEDNRFFEHRGIDVIGIGRALLSYLETGEKTQGGSTITMQVARNFFLSPQKTFQRKLMEVLLTLHIEQHLTKEDILELYLNQIFFGHRTYGIVAAAALYYDRPLAALTIAEIAMLAGIPKAPSANNPLANPARAMARRDYILGRMHALGYLTTSQLQQALATPNTARLHRREIELDAGYVAEMVRAEVESFYGSAAVTQGYRVTTTIDSRLQNAAQDAVRTALRQYDRRHGYRGPEATLKVTELAELQLDDYLATVTAIPTLTPALVLKTSASATEVYLGQGQRVTLKPSALAWARSQRDLAHWRGARRKAAASVQVGDLIRLRRTAAGNWELSQIPRVGGALVAVAPHNGAVRALVSGYSFNDTQFNRAVEMRRQPGSSFKPFVYAAALAKGWTPERTIRDQAVALPAYLHWNPQNSDHRELGPIPLRKALALSRNLASISLLQQVGLTTAQTFIRRFGFDAEALPEGLTMVLGTGAVSPVKLAEGYAVFANGGYHVIPYFIQRIEDGEGRILFEAQPPQAAAPAPAAAQSPAETAPAPPAAERVISPRVAYQMTTMLRGVIAHGTGFRAKRLGRSDIAGKTGTTNDIRDSWFAGFHASLVSVAWMGFDDFGKLGWGEEGGKAALGMWVEFMRQALDKQPLVALSPPLDTNADADIAADDTADGAPAGDIAPAPAPASAAVTAPSADAALAPPVTPRPRRPRPAPVAPRSVTAAPAKPKSPPPKPKPSAPPRSAPRVMDDLF
ncbi:peptidase [Chromatium okenii]|uniref:penicillin-binding protein 1A n=1 Tax=Chromatium okenii TaxID=61644 RepID=UPI001904740C|nr:PBP1A family penicillin-binding protein [Chromatium okenii]MBK1642261.1 peptidase [Chromatium okenii]